MLHWSNLIMKINSIWIIRTPKIHFLISDIAVNCVRNLRKLSLRMRIAEEINNGRQRPNTCWISGYFSNNIKINSLITMCYITAISIKYFQYRKPSSRTIQSLTLIYFLSNFKSEHDRTVLEISRLNDGHSNWNI